MKKISIAFLLSVLFLWGCDKYFENDPTGQYKEENFYKNINEVRSALNSVYAVMREKQYQQTMVLIGDGMGDDFINEYSVNTDMGLDAYRLCRYDITPDNQVVANWYNYNYRGIFRANMLLKHIHDSIDLYNYTNTLDEGARQWQAAYGEALFLRAFYYFNLVRSFGGVPVMPENADISAKYPRSSVDSVYAYIEKDLRTAAILLPIKNDIEFGTANRYAALAYLMKVMVYQAKPGVYSSKWEEAKKIGALLISGTGSMTFSEILKPDINYPTFTWDSLKKYFKFNLRLPSNSTGTDMTELSKPANLAVFQTSEGIFHNHTFNSDWGMMWRLADQNNPTRNSEPIFVIPVENVQGTSVNNTYNYIDILYGDGYSMSPPLAPTNSFKFELDPVGSNDPRKYYGVVGHNMDIIGKFAYNIESQGEAHLGGLGVEGNFLLGMKRFLISSNERPIPLDKGSMRNIMLMRYSEVVLLYAEAINESGDGIEAIKVLNSIRTAFKTSPSITKDISASLIEFYPYGSYSTVRDFIYHERRMELYEEFDRFWDIVRQGRAARLINYMISVDASVSINGAVFVAGKHELLPIPQSEIEMSSGRVVQNPGY